MFASREEICNVEYSSHKPESSEENLHKHIAFLLRGVLVMSSEQINSLWLLLFDLS